MPGALDPPLAEDRSVTERRECLAACGLQRRVELRLEETARNGDFVTARFSVVRGRSRQLVAEG